MKKLKVTYSSTAYVKCEDVQLSDIECVVTGWATGSENICTTVDDIDAILGDSDNFVGRGKLKTFLKAVLKEVSGKVGDVIFHR